MYPILFPILAVIGPLVNGGGTPMALLRAEYLPLAIMLQSQLKHLPHMLNRAEPQLA